MGPRQLEAQCESQRNILGGYGELLLPPTVEWTWRKNRFGTGEEASRSSRDAQRSQLCCAEVRALAGEIWNSAAEVRVNGCVPQSTQVARLSPVEE